MQAIPVSKLSGYLKQIIGAEELLYGISIFGEITDVKFDSNRNVYFSLKDEESSISCIFWGAAKTEYIDLIKNGEKVILTGKVDYWVKGGKIKFNTFKIEKIGLGEAYLKFLQVKERLEKEGLFKVEYKKPLPAVVKKVGVVTSETGAVINDIKTNIFKRNPFIEIFLYPSLVQGDAAAKNLSEGIKFLDKFGVDVIIIGRGGGSNEDLSAFNDEILARTIFEAKTVIVSAVGHDADISICDFVADISVSTPTAAAELVAVDVLEKYKLLKNRYSQVLKAYVDRLDFEEKEIKNLKKNLIASIDSFLKDEKSNLEKLNERLQKYNPLSILKRGYSVVYKDELPIIFNKVKIDDEVTIIMDKGKLKTRVIEKEEN